MDLSSSSIKESSSISSKKVSSSSVSSSSKISSSSSLSSASSALRGMSSEVDDLLAASASARETARGLSSGLTERLGALTSDLDIDDMLAGTNIGSSSLSSSSISSASSKKQVSKMSSISQSSLEVAEGSSLADASVKSSVKSHSSSVSSSSLLASQTKSVDGEIVSAETVAERSSKARESQKEKVVEDGQVLVDTGFKMEQSSAAKLRATKEMSQQELDGFFRGDAITGKPLEALNFDKDANTFEAKLVDLPEFSPQELTVKIVDDVITVYGTHEEKDEAAGTYKMHQYVRRFTVPKGLKADNIDWNLEPSGALAITAGDTVSGGKSQVHLDCTIFKPRSFFKKAE